MHMQLNEAPLGHSYNLTFLYPVSKVRSDSAVFFYANVHYFRLYVYFRLSITLRYRKAPSLIRGCIVLIFTWSTRSSPSDRNMAEASQIYFVNLQLWVCMYLLD